MTIPPSRHELNVFLSGLFNNHHFINMAPESKESLICFTNVLKELCRKTCMNVTCMPLTYRPFNHMKSLLLVSKEGRI